MWCCGVVTRVKRRDDKMIKIDIKWKESFIACGEKETQMGIWDVS